MPSSLNELVEQQAALERQIQQARADGRETALGEIRRLMTLHGLKPADVADERPASKRSRAPVAPKYRHPETGATWSGRGLKPRWLAAALGAGDRLERFLIADEPRGAA
jgi:DNA-binding protein H-NS